MSQHQTMTDQRARKVAGRIDPRRWDARHFSVADRIIPVFEGMCRRNQITRQEADAGHTYARYWHGARHSVRTTGSYGDPQWSGTRAGQASAATLTREEWPLYCAQQLARARSSVADKRVMDLFDRIVESDATLADVGESILGCRSKQQAMAAGAVVAKLVLTRLVSLYGYQPR